MFKTRGNIVFTDTHARAAAGTTKNKRSIKRQPGRDLSQANVERQLSAWMLRTDAVRMGGNHG
ncbi:MAG: hypothetical protein R6U68_05915 [Desulfobacteraceae bacterium]